MRNIYVKEYQKETFDYNTNTKDGTYSDAFVDWCIKRLETEIADKEKTIRETSVALSSVKNGVAEIMENVDEDGWAYEWCSKTLKQ